MAGSYDHCRDDDGNFTFDLIENMGDAYETCEMMFWMINHLADGDKTKIDKAENAYYKR